ncbi:MAG: GGDEF domain-containing protein [Lachnospiraceae bacterium]|nr:GGDEF domain-containing protein [Lachnospiraceae bacterium]
MRRKKGINYNLIYAVLAVVGIIVTVMASLNPYERNVHLIQNGAVDYNSGWEYKNNRIESYDICNLPLNLDKDTYRDITVRKLLGEESKDGTYLMYRSKHSENHVYIGTREIYTFGDHQSALFPLPGSVWVLIPLHDSYQGQYLTIYLHRIETKYGGRMEGVVIGDRADMLEKLLTENLVGIVSCFIIAFASIVLFLLGFIELRMVRTHNLFYLAVFSAVVFIWSMNETHCSQLFFGNMETVSILTYEAIAFLPMPLILYYRNSRHRVIRDISERIAIVPVINFIILNSFHFLGIADMSEILILTHITIFIVGGAIAIANLRAGVMSGRGRDSAFPELGAIGLVILVISVFIDIGHYYISSFVDASRYSRIGLLVFVILLAIDSMFLSLNDEIDVRKAEVYKSLAFTDSLTGLGNRQAYEQEIEKIDEREELLEHLVIGILDLNNLKRTNDAKGHAEGDRYIISSSDFVQKYFGRIAKIFRTGGDEFAVVFTGHDSDVYFETEANMFDDIMRDGRQDINFAYGSAIYNHITDRTATDTIRRAEAKMYDSKRKYKHKAGDV